MPESIKRAAHMGGSLRLNLVIHPVVNPAPDVISPHPAEADNSSSNRNKEYRTDKDQGISERTVPGHPESRNPEPRYPVT